MGGLFDTFSPRGSILLHFSSQWGAFLACVGISASFFHVGFVLSLWGAVLGLPPYKKICGAHAPFPTAINNFKFDDLVKYTVGKLICWVISLSMSISKVLLKNVILCQIGVFAFLHALQ